jgi:Domain of unknown function (DUF4189)
MSNPLRFILLGVLAFGLGLTSIASAADRYAAVAFSPVTGRSGYGNGYATKAEAISRALRECGRSDAATAWCRNEWIALAVSNQSQGGYGVAWGPTASGARREALAQCRSRNPDAHIVFCVFAFR